jgi:hypothetical protein
LNIIYKFGLILLNIIRNYVLKIRSYFVKLGECVIIGLTAAWEYDTLRLGVALFVIEVGITIPLPTPKKKG